MQSKRIIIMFITIGFIFLAIAGLLMFRLRGSVKITPDKDYAVSEELPLYPQDAIEWAEDMLGDSVYTMQSSGCLVTCIASAVSDGNQAIHKKQSPISTVRSEASFEMGRLLFFMCSLDFLKRQVQYETKLWNLTLIYPLNKYNSYPHQWVCMQGG